MSCTSEQRWPLIYNDFFLNRSFIVSNVSRLGNDIKYIRNGSPQQLRVSCTICSTEKWISARSIFSSVLNSWHKSYRCGKCVNVGRKHSEDTKIKMSKTHVEMCKIQNPKKKNFNFPYEGIVFRSSYEVRCAKILDKLNIKYEYEKQTLKIFDGRRPQYYLPDFYLPEFDIFIEVKGWWRDDCRLEKFNLFKRRYNLCLVMDKDLKEVECELRK